MTPEQCRAARELLNWALMDLAIEGHCHVETVRNFEEKRTAPLKRTELMLCAAFEAAGIVFVEEKERGPSVKLRRLSP